MRTNRTNRLAMGVALLALALPAGIAAQTASAPADKKYADLEARIAQLESQLKQQQAKPALVNAALPQEGEAAPAAVKETAAPPDALAGIKSILGGVNLTGLADVYYGYNANHPAFTPTEPFSPRRDAIGLNLVELQLEKPVEKSSPFGFRVALGFGDAMTAVNEFCTPTGPGCTASSGGDGDQTGTHYLKEGYGSYMAPIGKGLQIDFGKWVTPNGAEVIETNQNWNYSRSLLFYYAIPYYHFGGRVKYNFSDKLTVIGYAANGWNNITPDLPGNKTGGVTVVYSPTKKITISENWMGGPRAQNGTFSILFPPASPFAGTPFATGQWNNLSDTVLTYTPTSKLTLMFNYDYDRQNLPGGAATDYNGVAAYAKYKVNQNWAFATRGEYFNDHDGFATGTPQHLWETTGTIERVLANHVIARLEYRHDESNAPFFPRGGSPNVFSQDTAKIGLVFQLQPIAQ